MLLTALRSVSMEQLSTVIRREGGRERVGKGKINGGGREEKGKDKK